MGKKRAGKRIEALAADTITPSERLASEDGAVAKANINRGKRAVVNARNHLLRVGGSVAGSRSAAGKKQCLALDDANEKEAARAAIVEQHGLVVNVRTDAGIFVVPNVKGADEQAFVAILRIVTYRLQECITILWKSKALGLRLLE